MSKYFRMYRGYRGALRQHVTFVELFKEFPKMQAPRVRAIPPDPWDEDEWKKPTHDWKSHRLTQHRPVREPRPKIDRPKVIYDSPLTEYWRSYRFKYRPPKLYRFRVRLAYRHERCDP